MKELSDPRLLVALGLCVLVAGGCKKHRHYDDDPVIPTFFEFEPNDDPLTANDFGFLAPGDHFFIEGYITDSGFDPFDGFWFTSTQPIHVDFQLFIDDRFTDLDVCLYDPFLDQTIDCYQTANNPEQGGVDVTGADIDFHLVVESFSGASTYGLEIVVFPLPFAVSAEGTEPAPEGAGERLVARKSSAPDTKGADPAAFTDYSRSRNATETRTVIRSELVIDVENGLVIETRFVEEIEVPREAKNEKIR